MSDNDHPKSDSVQKPLSREEILSYEAPPKQVQLPSGVDVTVKYLPYLPVMEVLIAVKGEENKEMEFAILKTVIDLHFQMFEN